MRRKYKARSWSFFSLLIAATMVFASFASPVMAEGETEQKSEELKKKKIEFLVKSSQEEPKGALSAAEADTSNDDEGRGLHKRPDTFKKNFDLTPEQKEQTIKECEKIVADIIDPNMSDLEKYYTLALWANEHVNYDWEFWDEYGYHLDKYRHQWDAYGCMVEQKAVCVGIAIFYSNLCHAAGLPCKFIRMDPEILDHTISYIPDINGNAYYIDVTEDMFFMSEKSNTWNPLDKKCEFAKVDKDCTDGSFDYKGINGVWLPSKIKELWQKNVSFDKWFEEWALHKNTTKKFRTKYVERGSGVPATDPRYKTAAYTDPAYPSNFTDTPDVWFLDDFYRFRSSEDETKVDTEELKQKIINKQFDDMLLNISEIKPNYDIDTNKQDAEAQLKAAVEAGISKVKYFPASDENGKVVAMSAELTKGTDYEVSCEIKNDSSAIVKITGNRDYSDTYEKEVTLNTAVVTEPPVRIENLVYNGKNRELIKPGKAENGTMEYALGTATEPPADEEFSEDIPTGTDAGKYYVWYRAKGYGTHYDSQPQLMKPQARIKPQPVEIIAEGAVIKVGETYQLTPKLSIEGLDAQFTFYNDALGVTDVDENGLVRGIKPGVSHITISAAMESSQTNYEPEDETYVTVQVVSDERSTDPAVTYHSITYDLNGGELDGKTGTVEISCEEGSIITLPAPVRDGYTFDYWKGSRYEAGDEYTVKGDHTFTAQWVKDTGGSKKDSGKSSKTGDETNLISLMALLFASAGTLGAIAYRRRRNS